MASGGVGSSATAQLAKRCGAKVTTIAGKSKLDIIKSLGADQLIARDKSIIDNVADPEFPTMLRVLKYGGRYTSSIAGPMINFDMRDFYLKDINLIGCTAWDELVLQI